MYCSIVHAGSLLFRSAMGFLLSFFCGRHIFIQRRHFLLNQSTDSTCYGTLQPRTLKPSLSSNSNGENAETGDEGSLQLNTPTTKAVLHDVERKIILEQSRFARRSLEHYLDVPT